jgi:hypothetical protein
VAAASELLLAPIRQTIKERVFIMPQDEVQVVVDELGNDAGIFVWLSGDPSTRIHWTLLNQIEGPIIKPHCY